jgi:hypothetical protein
MHGGPSEGGLKSQSPEAHLYLPLGGQATAHQQFVLSATCTAKQSPHLYRQGEAASGHTSGGRWGKSDGAGLQGPEQLAHCKTFRLHMKAV